MSLPIALQVYSVRKEAASDLRATLEEIKKLGYDGVEFAGLYSHTAQDVKKMCEEIGLVPISAHVPYRDMAADPKGILSEYAALGCKYVVIPYLAEEDRPGTENFPTVIENAKKIGRTAKQMGMQLLYHNHDFEFVTLGGKYALDILYEEVPAELLGTELDTCWVNVGGEDPSAYLRKYSGRAPVVHLKDFYGEKSDDMYELIGIEKKAPARPSDFEFRPIGSGLQNIPEILKAANDAGAAWLVVEQDNPSMALTPFECAKKSIEYLKSL